MISSALSTSSGKGTAFSGRSCGARAFLALATLLLLCTATRAQRLHVYDIQATPKKITLKWDQSPPATGWSPPSQDPSNPMTPTAVGVGSYWNKLNRSPSGAGFPYIFSTQTTFNSVDWSANTSYEYWLSGFNVYYDRAYDSVNGYWYWSGPRVEPREWPHIFLSVQAIGVSAVATADSRLDMRFSTEHLLDYTFNNLPASGGGTTLYRGGLFAGFQQDSSRVGRTYLKFTGLAPSANASHRLWPVSGLQLYVPRLAKTGSVSLTTRVLTDENFSPSSLVWSNAPALGSSTARSGAVSWSASSPAGQWVTVNVTPDIEEALKTDNTLSLAVMSGNESGAGWAYIARPGFIDPTYTLPSNSLTPPNGLGPYLLFGLLGPGVSLSNLTVSPGTVTSGSSTVVTGTVTIPSLAPPNGFEVSLASNNSAASVPGSVIIPEGESVATFPVTWSGVTTATTATITGVLGNSRTATLLINPASGGGGGGGGGAGAIDSLALSAGSVTAGTSVTGTITLTAAAPTGGTLVNLTSGNTSAAQVPASVTVPAGATTKTFTITTGPGYAYYQPATITATSGTSSKSASLFVTPGGGGPTGPGGGPIGVGGGL